MSGASFRGPLIDSVGAEMIKRVYTRSLTLTYTAVWEKVFSAKIYHVGPFFVEVSVFHPQHPRPPKEGIPLF